MDLLRLSNVKKTFTSKKGKEVCAVDDVSFEVPQGNFVSLIGMTGCGKTTLLRLIGGLLKPTDGKVLFKEKKVDGPLENFGFAFQKPVLLNWRTALDNILLPAEFRRLAKTKYIQRAHNLIKLVGLEGFADSYPNELSGGMQQRVAICRALLLNPDLLLMDEPFGSIDAITRERLNLELIRIWQEEKKTIIFVTHNIDEAVFLSQQIVVLTPRPSRVARVIDINLPEKREISLKKDVKYGEYCYETREALGLQA